MTSPDCGRWIYERGRYTYEMGMDHRDPPGVVTLSKNWLRYRSGPDGNHPLSDEERLDVVSRMKALLEQEGWRVQFVEE